MRLDHLLSREKCEGEEPEHDPRSRVERVERFSELMRKAPEGRPARRRAEEKDASDESTVLEVFLHCIAFRVRPCGGLAQLGERVLCKHEVVGSSPISSTSFSSEKHTAFGLIAQLVRAHA